MDARKINDSQFAPLHFLYEREGFTVAFGVWEDKDYAIAVRWDGEGDAPGFPRGSGGQPKWLVLHRDLRWSFVCTLLATPSTPGNDVAGIAAALNVMTAERPGWAEGWLATPVRSHWLAAVGKQICIEPLYDLTQPNEPSQYHFLVRDVTATDVGLHKISFQQDVRVPLFALSSPFTDNDGVTLRATVLRGAIRFVLVQGMAKRWRWMPQDGAQISSTTSGAPAPTPVTIRRVPIQSGRRIPE